jgi:hypothetical protein
MIYSPLIGNENGGRTHGTDAVAVLWRRFGILTIAARRKGTFGEGEKEEQWGETAATTHGPEKHRRSRC